MSALKLVIFDVDGTLVDSQGTIVTSMKAAFGSLGKPVPDRSKLLSIVGLSLPQAFGVLAPWADDAQNAALTQAYKANDVASRAGGRDVAPLYPGARAALNELASNDEVLLGIATGKARRGLDILMETHDLGGLFHTQQVADHHPSKPHPSMVLAALAETGVSRENAVMIGDTTFDMEMARAAGVAGIGVGWGYHPAGDFHAAGAVAVLNDFSDLIPALANIWGPV